MEVSALQRAIFEEAFAGLPLGGICAGKRSVAKYLTEECGFTALHVASAPSTADFPVNPQQICTPTISQANNIVEKVFPNVESLLEFVTERWRERWVLPDIWDGNALRDLLKRPFFILVSVDAPVSLRWQRFKQRCVEKSECPTFLTY